MDKKNQTQICRLNYIGSKFLLLEWIFENIKSKTQWKNFADKKVADLFSGTGVVSYNLRLDGATVIANDAEQYSAVITHAFTCSTYTERCKTMIDEINEELRLDFHTETCGFITKHYTPYEKCERKFFTVKNGRIIDYIRLKIHNTKEHVTNDEYMFLLASLITSADCVSNVPAVYGCFLKNFKAKALKELRLKPIHTDETLCNVMSRVYNHDILDDDFCKNIEANMVYLDPPYNERQYSKNYFPLNIIAKSPDELLHEQPLKGKTGIPQGCFTSSFCKRGGVAEKSFDQIFRDIRAQWIFLSYNSESIVSAETMVKIMSKYGEVSVVERDYKKFKSFEYNESATIKEYLFCLKKN